MVIIIIADTIDLSISPTTSAKVNHERAQLCPKAGGAIIRKRGKIRPVRWE